MFLCIFLQLCNYFQTKRFFKACIIFILKGPFYSWNSYLCTVIKTQHKWPVASQNSQFLLIHLVTLAKSFLFSGPQFPIFKMKSK